MEKLCCVAFTIKGGCSMYVIYTITILCLSFFALLALVLFNSKSNIKMIVIIFTMANGLSTGLLAGIIFNDDLFLATIYSIGIVSILTVLLGLKLSYHDIIGELFSGMMSTMMGAMLSVMVSDNAAVFLLLLSLLYVISTTILELKHGLSQSWTGRQLALGLLLSLLLIVFVFISFPKKDIHMENTPSDKFHNIK